ncbi:MAG TPA: hypothetical protein VJ603_00980 [Paucimonas sp.]|nr:hypothetical protein [Paucimonas sp.]
MANVPESPIWEEGVYQLEQSDPVLGGPGGIANRQAEQLANRTTYLKEQTEAASADLAAHEAAADPHAQYATKLSVAAQIAALINSAPGALDTLNELAAALGNDPNFATTLTNSLAGKVAVSDKASTAQAQAGIDDTVWMTPAKVAQAIVALTIVVAAASETVAGKVELATNAETITGTDTVRATHPAGVKAAINAAIAALVNASPATLDTLNELATALGNDPNFAATITTALGLKAPLASPALTGTPTAPTAAGGTNTTQLATTAFVANAVAGAGGTTLGNTAGAALAAAGSPGVSTTAAHSDHVHPYPTPAQIGAAPLASPALTGTPTVPTAAAGTNTAQAASTAFVVAAITALINASPAALDTLNELATALGNDPNFATTMTNALAGKLPTAGGDMTGRLGIVRYDVAGVAKGNISGAQTLDLATANYFQATVAGATTFTFSGAAAAGRAHGFVLELTNGGAYTITWPATVKWPGGTAPTLTAAGVDVLVFITDDGGATWRGNLSIKDSR